MKHHVACGWLTSEEVVERIDWIRNRGLVYRRDWNWHGPDTFKDKMFYEFNFQDDEAAVLFSLRWL